MAKKAITIDEAKRIAEASFYIQQSKAQVDNNVLESMLQEEKPLAESFYAYYLFMRSRQVLFKKHGLELNVSDFIGEDLSQKMLASKNEDYSLPLSREEAKRFVEGYKDFNVAILGDKNINRISSLHDEEKLNACFNKLKLLKADKNIDNGKTNQYMQFFNDFIHFEAIENRLSSQEIDRQVSALKSTYNRKNMNKTISDSAKEVSSVFSIDEQTAKSFFAGVIIYSDKLNSANADVVLKRIIKDKSYNFV